MTKQDARTYSLFTGCLIPSKFPFIENASKKVLESLGLELHFIEAASCCPNQMAIQSSDMHLWYALAARNLCLAEEKGYDILSLCNGCYDTLKTVNTKLKSDDGFRAEINELLESFGLEFRGEIEVKHLVQVLHDDVGVGAIEKAVVNPLKGIKCAPFEGCHAKRPSDSMGFDSPDEPFYLADLIEVIGGDVVFYAEQYSCCGGGLSIARKDDVVPAARRVLCSVKEAQAEAIVVNCPFCFAQFYRSEREIYEIYSEKLRLPVFYITQLMGLALGFTPDELGLWMHYENSVGNERELVMRILGERADESVFTEDVTRPQLEICEKCLACTDDCPTAMTTSDYHPEEILKLVLENKVDEAIKRDDIWFCMNCHECVEACPQDFGMVKLIVRLKNMAAAKGIYPEVVGHRISELHETGYSFAPDTKLREEIGLMRISPPDIKELRKLLEKAACEKSENEGDTDA
ncbi:MAG: 4Fe-4S dicluster domain-containing protein [Methanomassiliicoccales archaeon]|nr:MAG: 4Fe-4S dicluster domain-containing protein [Methanomassiliicoccales archaeon]